MRPFSVFAVAALVTAAISSALAEDNAKPSAAGASARAEARLIYPNGLALDRDGGLLVSDIGSHVVFRCDGEGRLTVVAGVGKPGYSGDGGPATEARLNAPFEVLALPEDGGILVADTYNHRIRRIDREGRITTIAGNGKSAYAGDGGPAVEASLQLPQGIALDREGNLFIADTFNHVVRRVDLSGAITTFAGSEGGLAGDGGPATKAQLNLPMAVAVDGDGNVYISDAGNSRIRRVNRDGMIETVTGTGGGSGIAGSGYTGDDGPAGRAKIFSAADIEIGPSGSWYIADSGNNRIRVVRENAISTIAGSGEPDFFGDGGAALDAALKAPQKIAVHADGTIDVADRANGRVRRIDSSGKIKTLAGDRRPSEALWIIEH
jgi:sugar lactone lactonase YvrE